MQTLCVTQRGHAGNVSQFWRLEHLPYWLFWCFLCDVISANYRFLINYRFFHIFPPFSSPNLLTIHSKSPNFWFTYLALLFMFECGGRVLWIPSQLLHTTTSRDNALCPFVVTYFRIFSLSRLCCVWMPLERWPLWPIRLNNSDSISWIIRNLSRKYSILVLELLERFQRYFFHF